MISWILALFIGGVLLLLLEFVMPGLVCGIVGGCMMLGSIVLAVNYYPERSVEIIVGGVAITGIIFVAGFLIMPRFGSMLGLVQVKQQLPDEGYVNVAERTDLLQQEGVVFSALRPSGVIVIGQERIDAVSDAAFIDKDARVRVIAVEGNRIVVEAI